MFLIDVRMVKVLQCVKNLDLDLDLDVDFGDVNIVLRCVGVKN